MAHDLPMQGLLGFYGLSHEDEAFVGARNTALYKEKPSFSVDLYQGKVLYGHALCTHVSRHLLSF